MNHSSIQLAMTICTVTILTAACCAVPCAAQVSSATDSLPHDAFVSSITAGANLNDLAVVSEDRLCAVGDRGLILVSQSGGRHWETSASRTTANLHGVGFDTPHRGIVVGGAIGNYTRSSQAVVLRTRDGGQTWEQTHCAGLPRLLGIHFQNGRAVAWGDYSPAWQTSVFESLDGGLSWHGSGVPIGHATAVAVVGGANVAAIDRLGRMVLGAGDAKIRDLSTAQRPMHALHHTGRRWLVCGEHGELISSVDGNDWINVSIPLSAAARACCTWKTIAQVGDDIWIAGAPGSLMLHSRDRGQSFSLLHTGQTLPVSAVRFIDSARGWAVGPLGSILASRDGGKTWYAQRQPVKRLGLLAVSADDASVPWAPLVAAAWDEQLATGSLVLACREAIDHANFLPSTERQYAALAPQVGIAQQRYLSEPFTAEAISAAKLAMAVELLSWRPDLVLISDAVRVASPSAPAVLAPSSIVPSAIELAEKAEQSGVARELGLAAWNVNKLVSVTDERNGQFSEQSLRILRAPGLAIRDLLSPLPPGSAAATSTVSMRTLWTRSHAPAAMVSLLGAVAPSRETRWDMPIQDIGNYQLVMGRIHRDRTLLRLGETDGRIASDSQWDEGLAMILKGMPPREVAPAIYRLVGWLAQPHDWPRKRAALERLIENQPTSDAADWARCELLRISASDEFLAWTRLQQAASRLPAAAVIPSDGQPAALPAGNPVARTETSDSGSVWNGSPFGTAATEVAGAKLESSVVPASAEARKAAVSEADRLVREQQAWFPLLESVLRDAPALRSRPDLSLLTHRMMQNYSASRQTASPSVLDKSVRAGQLIGWPQVAQQEMLLGLNNIEGLRWIALAVPADQPPLLDGELKEAFWQQAPAMKLAAIADDAASSGPALGPARIHWAYDAEYLYMAIECPRRSDAEVSPLKRVRTYDSDLQDVDRVEFLLDTDRDYNTAIELAVAEDGRTFDRLAGQPEYNPKWHVFVKPEASDWTAEIAVEIRALTTRDALMGEAWAVSARRHDPTGPSQSWSQLKTHQPLLQGNGLLLFLPPSSR